MQKKRQQLEDNLLRVSILIIAAALVGVTTFVYFNYLLVLQEVNFVALFAADASSYPKELQKVQDIRERHFAKIRSVPINLGGINDIFAVQLEGIEISEEETTTFLDFNEDNYQVSSSDGGLTLTIPRLALPLFTDPSDIFMTRIPESRLPITSDGRGGIVAYQFEPKALVFLEPVTVSFSVPASQMTFPIVMQFQDNGSLKKIGNTIIDVNPSEGIINVSTQISDLNTLAYTDFNLFSINIEPSTSHAVGEKFTSRVTVKKQAPPTIVWSDGGSSVFSRTEDPWLLAGEWEGRGAIEPSKLKDRPARTENDPSVTQHSATDIFTCIANGSYQISYTAELFWVFRSESESAEELPHTRDWLTIVSNESQCQ